MNPEFYRPYFTAEYLMGPNSLRILKELPGEVLYFGLTFGREYRELKKIAKNRAKKEAQQYSPTSDY